MSTVWDRAVRALQTVHPDLDAGGHPLAYYCGGPDLTCTHNACRYVSALAEADLLYDGADPSHWVAIADEALELREINRRFEADRVNLRSCIAGLIGDMHPDLGGDTHINGPTVRFLRSMLGITS